MLRGTISELVPNDYVVLVTATGEQRKFQMSEVKYAGPASGMPTTQKEEPEAEPKPSAPPKSKKSEIKPFTTIHGAEARLRLTGAQGLTFHRRSSSATAIGPGGTATAVGFDEMCAAPCEVSIPAGRYVLALSKDTDTPVAGEDSVSVPAGNSVVEGTYIDKSGTRVAGWIVGAVGIGVGAYLILTSSEDKETCDELTGCTTTPEINTTKLYLGLGAIMAGSLVGWLLIKTSDSASFTVLPGTPVSRLPSSTAMWDSKRLRDLGGLTATARF